MPAFACSEETIRVPKQHFGPVRDLPQQYAKARPRRWPHIVIAVLAVVAFATPVKMPGSTGRSAQAHELLRMLGR
jgi:hypothetical protein